jgi:transposase
LATLLTTAKMNGVDPFAWLKQTLERIAKGWPNRDIEALMPWNYAPWSPGCSSVRPHD